MPPLNKHNALNYTAHLSLAIMLNKFKAQFIIQTWISKCTVPMHPNALISFTIGSYMV